MRITWVETVMLADHPNLIHVLVGTDEGIIGFGETYFGAQAIDAWVHETAAPILLGKDPLLIAKHSNQLRPFLGFGSTGVETRGRSAVDIALWDILGKVTGQPIYQLLGGATRDRIQVYNTCAGPRYLRDRSGGAGLTADNWGIDGRGRFEDLAGFLNDAGGLAESLLEQGIRCMKIWPLDLYAEINDGHYISNEDLANGIRPFELIRETVGSAMDIIVEMHSLWDLPTAKRIIESLEEFDPLWIEDPIRMDNFDTLARLCDSTRVPIAASETLASAAAYKSLLDTCDIGVVIFDPAWVGGITESVKISALAEMCQTPIAPHDCSGPIEFAASVHLTISQPTAIYQESVRAFYDGWYGDLVTEVPKVADGYVYPLTGPGLGTELQPGIRDRADATNRKSSI